MYYHQLSPYLNKAAEGMLMESVIRVDKICPLHQTPDHIIKSGSPLPNGYHRVCTPMQNNSPSWGRSLCSCFISRTTSLSILCRTYKDKGKKKVISDVGRNKYNTYCCLNDNLTLGAGNLFHRISHSLLDILCQLLISMKSKRMVPLR